jgi:N-glycosylase/DNA lyase
MKKREARNCSKPAHSSVNATAMTSLHITTGYTATLSLSSPLNLHDTLFCGQAFRWQVLAPHPLYDYFAVVHHAILALGLRGSTLYIFSSAPQIQHQPLTQFVAHYLGLSDQLDAVFSPSFRLRYPHVVQGASMYFGLRLLRQAPFETLISFMCAQGIGIALIRRQIQQLSQEFGTKLDVNTFARVTTLNAEGDFSEQDRIALSTKPSFISMPDMDRHFYLFPTPAQLAEAPLHRLRRCTNNNLQRARHIRQVARAVADGALRLETLSAPHSTLEQARQTLLEYDGIGEKIADCICLFGLQHHDAFPIDTHVRQYLAEWFGLVSPTYTLTARSYRHLAQAARKLLDTPYPGLAGQWLFHHWRRNIKQMTAY